MTLCVEEYATDQKKWENLYLLWAFIHIQPFSHTMSQEATESLW